ncbi:hypothetical protein GE09DRAFT_1229433 [Coniochaeta sp. 2T2.1]|nr:hypothetical protein GE09DRAFT_1229433 [Coniochaeta sp. 2T2.1]
MKSSFVIAFVMAAVASAAAVAEFDRVPRAFIEARCHCDGHCCAGWWCDDNGSGQCCGDVHC